MSAQSKVVEAQPEKKNGRKPEPAVLPEHANEVAGVAELPGGLVVANGDSSVQKQAARLSDTRFQTTQRHAIASQIGKVQGNLHLQHVIHAVTQKGNRNNNGHKDGGNGHKPNVTTSGEFIEDLKGGGAGSSLTLSGAGLPPNGNGNHNYKFYPEIQRQEAGVAEEERYSDEEQMESPAPNPVESTRPNPQTPVESGETTTALTNNQTTVSPEVAPARPLPNEDTIPLPEAPSTPTPLTPSAPSPNNESQPPLAEASPPTTSEAIPGSDTTISPETETTTEAVTPPAERETETWTPVGAEAPSGTTQPSPEPTVTMTELDLNELVENPVNIRPALAQFQQSLSQRKLAIQRLGESRKAEISRQAEVKRLEVRSEASLLIQQIQLSLAKSRLDVNTVISQNRASVKAELREQKAGVEQLIGTEAERLGREAARFRTQVTQAAQSKLIAARALGETQARRANEEVSRQAEDAQQRGATKAGTFRDKDPGRVRAQQDAVRRVAQEQAKEIQKTGPELAKFARDQAAKIAVNFPEQANKIANEIARTTPQAQATIRNLIPHAHSQMDRTAQITLNSLNDLKLETLNQLNGLETVALPQIQRLEPELIPKIDAAERAALEGVDQISQETGTLLDESARASIASLAVDGNGIGQDVAFAQFLSEQSEIENRANTALTAVGEEFNNKLAEVVRPVMEPLSELGRQTIEAAVNAVQATKDGTVNLVEEAGNGYRFIKSGSQRAARELADQVLDKYREPVNKAIAEFDTAYLKGERELIAGVTEGLNKNNQSLSQLDSKMTTAAAKAAEEYDQSRLERIGWAILKAIGGAIVGIAILLVVAVAVFVVALVLAYFGIIAAISFGVALVVAMIIMAIVAVVMEAIARANAYVAEYGPIDNIWKAIGVASLIVFISIASLTGIPQIIEGIRGKRFLSDRQLSEQQSYDLIAGGVLQLILLLLGLRMLRGLRTPRGGGIEPPAVEPRGGEPVRLPESPRTEVPVRPGEEPVRPNEPQRGTRSAESEQSNPTTPQTTPSSTAEQIAGGHAFDKHVINQGEFPEITTRSQFAALIDYVINNKTHFRNLSNGRSAYWHDPTGTVVIRNPASPDGGTCFRPSNGKTYFDNLH